MIQQRGCGKPAFLLDAERTIKNLGGAQPGSGPGCPPSPALPRKSCTAHRPLQIIVRGVMSGALSQKESSSPPPRDAVITLPLHNCH